MSQEIDTINANGKRNLPPATADTVVSSGSHGTVQPPAKKKVSGFLEAYAAHQLGVGAAPSLAQLSTRATGTDCYGIAVSAWKGTPYSVTDKSGKPTKAQFNVTTLRVILGTPDVAKNILVDEKTGEILFTVPDVDEYMAAIAKRRENKSSEFTEIKKTEEYKVPLYSVQQISVKDKLTLPGVEFPCIVRIVGLACRPSRAKVKNPATGLPLKDENGKQVYSDKVYYDLNATDVVPLECVGRDPALIRRYLENCGVMSNWYHEEPFATDAELENQDKGGRHSFVIPIVRKDNVRLAEKYFGQNFTADRSFIATVRPEKISNVRNFFYLSEVKRNQYKTQAATNPHMKIPDATEACLDYCKPFSICARWPIAITQYDKAVHPMMGPDHEFHYEIEVAAFGKSLWSAGVSHPEHWAVFRFHIPFMEGVLLCQEDRKGTCSRKINLGRHQAMVSAPKGSPESLGFSSVPTEKQDGGQPPMMLQCPKTWSRGVVLDVPSYLRTYGLRCSFPVAISLLGFQRGDADDPARPLRFIGKWGDEPTMVREGRQRVVKDIHLDFAPEGFVCLNALTSKQSLRALNDRVDQYYVLTTLSPRLDRVPGDMIGANLTAMKNAAIQAAAVPRIKDEEVIAICTQACRTHPDKIDMEKRALAADASDSLKAAGEWLAAASWGDTGHGDTDETPPYLVFATYKQDARQSDFLKNRSDAAFNMATKGWTQGPSCNLSGASIRINAPNQDEIDEALCAPDDDDDDDDDADDSDGGESGSEGEGAENMIQASQEYDDDYDDAFGNDDGGGDVDGDVTMAVAPTDA